jgi:Leucine-rich repeat (LRR) protein
MQTYILSLAIAFSGIACYAQETLQIDVSDEGKAVSLRLNGNSAKRVEVTPSLIDDLLAFDEAVSLSLFGTSTTDADLKRLAALKNLRSLDLSYTSVTDLSAESIAQLKNLQILKLEGTETTDATLETVAKLPEISMLHLAKTKISDRGLKHFKNHKTLNVLDLSSCEITDAGLQTIGKPPILQSLWLAKTVRHGEDDKSNFTDACIDYLLTLDTLIHLDVADSRISEIGLERLRDGLKKCKVSTSSHGVVYVDRAKN